MKHIYYICVGSYILLSFFAIRQWFRHIWQKKIKALEVHFFKSVEMKAEVKKGEEERGRIYYICSRKLYSAFILCHSPVVSSLWQKKKGKK